MSKQNYTATNARLNHLIDAGLNADQVKEQLNDKRIKLQFIKNIINKRINRGIR